MNITRLATLVLLIALLGLIAGCNQSGDSDSAGRTASNGDAHTHADGSTHADHDDAEDHEGKDHAHDEVSLGTITIGDMEVELAQGHGAVEAGKEGHLVVKLPYSDQGATVVRAWIGTEDRTLSFVGKGEYAPSHDDYDIHAMAPDPLPANATWWIEIEKPDGTKVVGSAKPIFE
jgi:hypothetical protein